MLGPFLCGPLAGAPLLPKLRGLFAEFLSDASSVGLGILSPSTCVGLRYGCVMSDSGFSRRALLALPYFKIRCASRPRADSGGFASPGPASLARGFPFRAGASRARPHSSVMAQYRNLNLLPVGYGLRPRLRPRLTQGGSALPWKPWIFGPGDSHPCLATHSGILPARTSTASSEAASSMRPCSPTMQSDCIPGFGGAFQPRTFSARDLSASELLRTL